jgi:hypothetical protein
MKDKKLQRYSLDIPHNEMVRDEKGKWVKHKDVSKKDKWLPIKTLKTSHIPVLVLYESNVFFGWLDHGGGKKGGWCYINYGDTVIYDRPTHWMPAMDLPGDEK